MVSDSAPAPKSAPLLEINDLAVSFARDGGNRRRAVDGVSLTIHPGQTLAVVGESGSGKSVTALSILRLIAEPPGGGRIERGSIMFGGFDLLKMSRKLLLSVRGGEIAMIFQEPMTSLNPVFTIGDQIIEAILLHQHSSHRQARQLAIDALDQVGISRAAQRLNDYPHQFSGGMRQRVMIAMALACQPKLLLADEPTTALDVTIQAQILQLLRRIQRERNMAIMLITHDLGVVAQNADVVCVMYAGRVVEYAAAAELFRKPLHPYTQGLLQCRPKLRESVKRLPTIASLRSAAATTHTALADSPEPWWPSDDEDSAHRHVLQEVEPEHWIACHPSDLRTTTTPRRPDIAVRSKPAS